MPSEPVWVPVDILIGINRDLVAETGEPHLLLSAALLESAWAKPINRWSYEGEEDMLVLAVAFMVGIAQNHPFQQGNKRTAFEAGIDFLRGNGYGLSGELDSTALADLFVEVVAHRLDEGAFVAHLRPHVVPLD